jgi:proteasome accessory factor B
MKIQSNCIGREATGANEKSVRGPPNRPLAFAAAGEASFYKGWQAAHRTRTGMAKARGAGRGKGAAAGPARVPKIALLLRLLAAIDEGRHGFAALAERVDPDNPPSIRTLRRYLATLCEAGFPWHYDRESGTYRFESGYSLRRLSLSGSELFGLLALRGIATSLGGNIGASMGEMTEKLTRVADRVTAPAAARTAVRLQVTDPHLDAERGAIFEMLQKAQRDRQSVRFGYVDKAGRRSARHVDTYGFVVSGGRVYVVAHDRGRGAKRVFALDGISGAKIAPQRFTLPDDFDIEAFAARSVSGIMHGDQAMTITVRFSAVVARAAKADRVVRERSLAEHGDGSIDITYTVADCDEFVRWTAKWGAEAEILWPPQARILARDLALSIARKYEVEARAAYRSGA